MAKQHDISEKQYKEVSSRLAKLAPSNKPMSFRKMVFELYPQLREAVEVKGLTRKEVYSQILDEDLRSRISLSTFMGYYKAAADAAAHAAKAPPQAAAKAAPQADKPKSVPAPIPAPDPPAARIDQNDVDDDYTEGEKEIIRSVQEMNRPPRQSLFCGRPRPLRRWASRYTGKNR